ncbi:hypothetical protein QBC46DRAFT_420451 [Diplogelasinospora grovesii]|uniref:Rhodopsin domain-containing protein n=1 Tax=Diplogelasinospora grovesii TaxID=303347 RepID=A0AAN6MZ42_9PEZI|nr:hypothetical protein QBC46DRAFT_420451 [Diplogelasinospora grovesii]
MDSAFPNGIEISERAAYLARLHIGITSTVFALCALTFYTRMHQRMKPNWNVGQDDWFLTAGFVLSLVDFFMLLPMMITSPGFVSLPQAAAVAKSSWLATTIWGLAMTCVKVSTASTLLRIKSSLRWKSFLYTFIGIQVIYGIGNTLFDLLACRPLAAAWDPTIPGGKCVDPETILVASNVGSAINITTDVLLSLAPATFLRKLNRPLRERIFVCCLMGMGVFASVSSITKTFTVQRWSRMIPGDDDWALGVAISTWTIVEEQLAILAACLPAQKVILQRLLAKIGINLTSRGRGGRSPYYNNDAHRRAAGPGTFANSTSNRHVSRYGIRDGQDDGEWFAMTDMSGGCSTPRTTHTDIDSFNEGNSTSEHRPEQLPAQAV